MIYTVYRMSRVGQNTSNGAQDLEDVIGGLTIEKGLFCVISDNTEGEISHMFVRIAPPTDVVVEASPSLHELDNE